MGNSQSSSATQFTSEGLPVLQSVKPCHLSGDPDLYGIGIRVGFYLQYAAAIIAVVVGIDRDFKGWRVAFVPLAAATFIALCINSTANSLVILDWSIMLELVLWFPAFFAAPVLKGFPRDFESKDQLRQSHKYMQQVKSDRELGFQDYRESLAIVSGALIDVVDSIMEHTIHSPGETRQLVRRMEQVALEWDGVIQQRPPGIRHDAQGNPSEVAGPLGPLGPVINRVLGNSGNASDALAALQREIPGAQLGQRPKAALRELFRTIPEAEKAYDGIFRTMREEKATSDYIKFIGFVLKRMHDLGLVDTVSAGLSLIIYSAYCFFTPWLFFTGIDRGAKAGCDIKVLFFFVPLSVYNQKFALFLKVAAVMATVVGLIFLILGGLFLIAGLSDVFKEADAENQPPDQPTQQNIGNIAHNTPTVQRRDDTTQYSWITTQVHRIEKVYQEYVKEDDERRISHRSADEHIQFSRLKWGSALIFALAYTVGVVEATIKVNGLTSGTLLTSTGGLIALVVGIFMMTVIAFRCIAITCHRLGITIPGMRRLSLSVRNSLYHILRSIPGNRNPQRGAVAVPAEQTPGIVGGRQPEMIENRRIEEVV